jgi:serine/threonine-protein kinase RsbW
MQKKILIVDDHDDLASLLAKKFRQTGHFVRILDNRREAVKLIEKESFDLIISDLDGEHLKANKPAECLPDEVKNKSPHSQVKAFKLCVKNYDEKLFSEEELKGFVHITLDCKARCVDKKKAVQKLHEKIEFEIPSYLSLMHDILNYLMKRVGKVGIVNPQTSNLFVALDEAFVNAVKHGNKFDSRKLVRVTADVSPEEARFTIEDEGEGFDVSAIPDPLDPENLFKTSGRGVLFIYSIMDEVKYNERGNRLTMVKKNETSKTRSKS